MTTLSDHCSVLANPLQNKTKPLAVVFWEEKFPAVEGCSITYELLQQALGNFDVVLAVESELEAQLANKQVDLFITPFGSAFPRQAFPILIKYLKAGGNWLNLGGAPLTVPVERTGSRWQVEQRQTAYHKRLGITHSFPVAAASLRCESSEVGLAAIKVDTVFELYLRLSSSNNEPEESGSDGPREAVVHPLVFAVNAEGRRLAAPIIQIDRLQADFAGGRWVFAAYTGTIGVQAIKYLAELAAQGAIQFEVRSSAACYQDGEAISLAVSIVRPDGALSQVVEADCKVEVRDATNNVVARSSIPLAPATINNTASGTIPLNTKLKPGFFVIQSQLEPKSAPYPAKTKLTATNGFWIDSNSLILRKPPLTVDNQFFYRNGAIYLVTGTTYMASDVHRQFLFAPNPQAWDKDFREMKSAGVNMVRTGIWTGWKKYMPVVGKLNEGTLRALDAFLLTADRYDIPVIFTFFAFLPETWGGANAYLDPRAVNAQCEFVKAFARRYANVDTLIWDLINEPSFCSPQHLWSCRPNYDDYEKAAWRRWLRERYPNESDEGRIAHLQQLWRSTDADPLELPKLSDFDSVNIIDERQPLKTLDYRLFAQDMFSGWVNQVSEAIRTNGNTKQLITVGQDEAGLVDSPNPHFFAPAVNFTSIHNWWANDDLVWDSVLAKTNSRANLVEETGIMFYEKTDGAVWRTEQEARNLLERKMAISLAIDGAGFIEWIWNTNPYMNSTNEVGIGFHRVDQTAKPELIPFLEISKFMAAHGARLRDRWPTPVAMVIPHAQMFSPRSNAIEATRRCVRAMFYHCHVAMQAYSEYKIQDAPTTTKLFIIPSPRVLSQACWEELLRRVKQGATVAITGAFDSDEHLLPVARLAQFGWTAETELVAESESITIAGRPYLLRFEGEKIQRVEKAILKNGTDQPLVAAHGAGYLLWCPLPLELSDSMEALTAFYRGALSRAHVDPLFSVLPQTPAVLTLASQFSDVALYTFVSEIDRDTRLRVLHRENKTSFSVLVPAGRAKFVMLDRKSGHVDESHTSSP